MKSILKILSISLISFSIIGCATDLQKATARIEDGQYKAATSYLEPLANEGNPIAQYYIGVFSELGLGNISQDIDQAVEWYILSAEREIPASMFRLAVIKYNNGETDAAINLFNRSARWGYGPSRTALANLNMDVPSDDLLRRRMSSRISNIGSYNQAIPGWAASENTAVIQP